MTNDFFTLTDGRISLVAATENLLELELAHQFDDIFRNLGTTKPPYWPPDANDDDSFRHFLGVLRENRDNPHWGAYYLIDTSEERSLVGCGGFIAPPDNDGTVEIGYSVLAPCRLKGHATALVRLLVAKAFSDAAVTRIQAHTYSDNSGSIRVLEKSGFVYDGKGAEGTVRYQLNRS